jgi:hypothetical protein
MTHEGMWRIYSNPDPHGSVQRKGIALLQWDIIAEE